MPGTILPACGTPPAHDRDRQPHDFWTGRGRGSNGALTVPVPASISADAEQERQRQADIDALPDDPFAPISDAERQRWDAAWNEAPGQQGERALDLFAGLARMAYRDEGESGLRRICTLVGLDTDRIIGELRRQREQEITARAREARGQEARGPIIRLDMLGPVTPAPLRQPG